MGLALVGLSCCREGVGPHRLEGMLLISVDSVCVCLAHIDIVKVDGSIPAPHRHFEKAHNRSIRRVKWNPLNPDVFASLSQVCI